MREWFRFWRLYIQMGREYWKKRGLWSILAYLDQTATMEGPLSSMAKVYLASMNVAGQEYGGRSIADDVEQWLASRPVNPEDDGDGA